MLFARPVIESLESGLPGSGSTGRPGAEDRGGEPRLRGTKLDSGGGTFTDQRAGTTHSLIGPE